MLIIGGIAGPPILAGLGLALSACALISLALVYASSWSAAIAPEKDSLRVFKGENAETTLGFEAAGRRWMRAVSLSLDEAPGIEGECEALEPSRYRLTLKPSLAGRFRVTSIRLKVTDVLGLFAGQVVLPTSITVDSLPLALLTAPRATTASPIRAGERPAGRRGSGQELYAVAHYDAGSDAKEILWKRVARMDDEPPYLPVRVREANVRSPIGFGVDIGWTTPTERVESLDLACEALAQVGRTLVAMGTALEFVPEAGQPKLALATNEQELSELIMAIASSFSEAAGRPDGTPPACDLLLLTPDKAERYAATTSRDYTPVIVLSRQPPEGRLPAGARLFTGPEDLSDVTVLVLNR